MSAEFMPEEIVDEYDPALDSDEDEGKPRRDVWGLVSVIAAIVIVIVVLLMLRDCGGERAESGSDGGKTIESVDGMAPADGLVSVWISDATDVGTAIASAGISSSDRIDMGGGRFVLGVPKGSEDSAVKKLASVAGVHDAGRVYQKADADN